MSYLLMPFDYFNDTDARQCNIKSITVGQIMAQVSSVDTDRLAVRQTSHVLPNDLHQRETFFNKFFLMSICALAFMCKCLYKSYQGFAASIASIEGNIHT